MYGITDTMAYLRSIRLAITKHCPALQESIHQKPPPCYPAIPLKLAAHLTHLPRALVSSGHPIRHRLRVHSSQPTCLDFNKPAAASLAVGTWRSASPPSLDRCLAFLLPFSSSPPPHSTSRTLACAQTPWGRPTWNIPSWQRDATSNSSRSLLRDRHLVNLRFYVQ